MKAMLAAFIAMIVISIGASMYLSGQGLSASEQATGSSVRLD